ncbi:MAG TPA: glycosyltransferase [Candidatus Dormibacteraeota bacterium]|nr:glycosyltransferase [Candidatus Dormibacteraeota bacterium]
MIPVYNEGEGVAHILREVRDSVQARPLEVTVVYDFDEDVTLPVLLRLQPEMPELRPLRNTMGPGVLNALRSGFQAARAPYVLVMMGDGSDEVAAVDRMLTLARAGADVVAASRYMPGGAQVGGPLLKRAMSRAAGLSLHWVGGLPIHDPTSNFKLYSRRLLDAVRIESTGGFELALELCVKANRLGFRLAETPTVWRDRTTGKSRFRMRAWLPRYLHWYWFGLRTRGSRRRSYRN